MSQKTHLNREDFRTDVWKRLTKTLGDELQRLRELNDFRMDEVSTAEIRGQIKVVKGLLALGIPSAQSSERPEFPAAQLAELRELGIDL